jgi:hypothetical protein
MRRAFILTASSCPLPAAVMSLYLHDLSPVFRLLAYTYEEGLHIDSFKLPIACSCHVRQGEQDAIRSIIPLAYQIIISMTQHSLKLFYKLVL